MSLESHDGCEVLLGEYQIKAGSEKMPFGVGNSWTYVSATPESINFSENYEVIYSKAGERVVLSGFTNAERVKYDENSWKDIMLKLRTDYYTLAEHVDQDEWDCDGRMRNDVSETLQRLKKLAGTPYEKLFSDKADSVMRRLISSNPNFVPDCKEVGIWNFFNVYKINTKDGIKHLDCKNYHFEWKWWYSAAYMLMHNFMLEELSNCGAVWDDDWKPGYSVEKTSYKYGEKITAAINCEDGKTVTTAAGTFEDCLKVTIDFSGFSKGHNYMNGKKEYFFAKGIGIVKCIHHTGRAVYELTGYEGTGEGYMPLEDGISRHYEGIDFPCGMRGSVDFVCAADDIGQLIMIVDQLGQQSREDWNNSDQPEKKLARK